MKIAIIRSCDRDDLRAKLCYHTLKRHKVADKIIFFHEGTNYPQIDKIQDIDAVFIQREFCDNFGGENNILTMLKEIKAKLPTFNDDDFILFCDADIIMFRNPFSVMPEGTDHAGFFDPNNKIGGEINHISGQLNIVTGSLWNLYIEAGEEGYRESRKTLDKYNYSIADDSIFSVFSHFMQAKQFTFINNECWLHYKIQPEEYENYL